MWEGRDEGGVEEMTLGGGWGKDEGRGGPRSSLSPVRGKEQNTMNKSMCPSPSHLSTML